MDIRSGEAGDLPFALSLAQKVFGGFGNADDVVAWWTRPEVMKFVAVEPSGIGDRRLGFSMMCFRVEDEIIIAHLVALAVAEEVQRRGVGRRLFGHLIAVARRTESEEARLEVADTNLRARAMFERARFTVMPGEWGQYKGGQAIIRMKRALRQF